MIDLKQLRENPERFVVGSQRKGIQVHIDRILALDATRRTLLAEQESLRAEQKRLEKESGVHIGRLMGQIKSATGDSKSDLEAELNALRKRPAELKAKVADLEYAVAAADMEMNPLLLHVPMPPDADVPVGDTADDNVEIRRWNSPTFDTSKSFEQNRGFKPKAHTQLVKDLALADFERGVKMAGTRSYVMTGMGMRLHQAVLRFAFDFMVEKHAFSPMSVPVIVREECMVNTGFFPAGREQAYHIEETKRGGGHDLYLTGTGEVGLMGIHQDEILDESRLPLKYVTVSTCFRREAGAAGKDTAGLYRIHQFDKVEQVVICRADEQESRAWHKKMIGFVEELLQTLQLPYRLLQCCTGDLGPKNADMIDIESWMPGRGEVDAQGAPKGAYSETHSASRLYDYQCRRLNMRYKGESTQGKPVVAHSLNNTVLASPRILIPILEMYQDKDGTVRIPDALRKYMGGAERIG